MPDESDPKILIKKRGSYKGQLTNFLNYLETLNVEKIDASESRELQLRVGKVELLFDRFDEVQLQLECSTDTLEAQLSERTSFENQYYRAMTLAQDLLASCKVDEGKECSKSLSGQSGHSHTKNSLVKLPTIQLPKFSGSYDNWLEFRDTFLSLIHDNDEIDKINKFHYLRSSLEGSASVVLKSVEFSASSYDSAWQLLCDRYNNKRLLVQNHVSSLFNIQPVTKESSAILKGLVDQINKNLRALESLGEPINKWDTLLIYIFTNKLDSKTLREWEELKSRMDKNSTILFSSFIEFLRNRADVIETLELSRHSYSASTKNSHKLQTMMSVQNTLNTNSCPKCRSDHHLNNCSQFLSLSINERKQALMNFKICHNCFRSGHYANQCKRPGCKICKRKHNTLIHVNDKSNAQGQHPSLGSDNRSQPPPPPPQLSIPSSARAADFTGSDVTLSANVTASALSEVKSEVLLSTALVKLYGQDNKAILARAVLDSGSTACLITNTMFDRLRLPYETINKSVQGINYSLTQVGKLCHINMQSLHELYSN